MKAKMALAGLMVGLMALAAPMVYAEQGMADKGSWHDGDRHHGDHFKMLAKILGLSDDQVKQLKDLKEKQKDTMKATFEQLKSNREAFDAEIVKATPDMNKINDLQTQLKTIQGQMVDNHLNAIMDIRKVMTPEQFAGYMALEKAKKMMMHHRFGHHDGFGQKMDGKNSWNDKMSKDEDQD